MRPTDSEPITATPGGALPSSALTADNSLSPPPSDIGGLGGGLGGLSSLSTLSGLLDTASTFKPKKEEQTQLQRGGKETLLSGGRLRQGQTDSGRFDEFFKTSSSGRQAGRGGWRGDRDFGRLKGDGMQKSFGPRSHGMGPGGDDFQPRLGSTPGSEPVHPQRSSLSTPGASASTPSDSSLPATPAKTDLVVDEEAMLVGASPASSSPPGPTSGHETPAKQTDDGTAGCVVTTEQRPIETKPSPWRPRRQVEPAQQLRREVNGLLNKLTIENFPTVAEKLARIGEEAKTTQHLETIVELVLDKAFSEPDFSELYADLCLVLKYRCSRPLDSATSGKQSVFSSLLIQKWKEAFEKLPPTVELTPERKAELTLEDQEIFVVKMKTRVRGMCVSLAEFVVRRMVGMGGFNRAASVLLTREAPEEHYIEGICQMLSTAGAFLDDDPVGKPLVETCFGRLQELQTREGCSKRTNCLIQDLIDARKVGWHKKIHKEKAKGLSALKEEVENADLVGGSVVTAQYGTIVKLGQRSNLGNENYARFLAEQEEQWK